MAVTKYTLVSYDGTDIGKLYLGDIGARPQLGAGLQNRMGQDAYVRKGETIALVNTGDVLLSSIGGTASKPGTLRRFSTDNDAALLSVLIKSGVLAAGTTGFNAPLTLIPSDTVTGVVRLGTTGVKTDPSKTIGDF